MYGLAGGECLRSLILIGLGTAVTILLQLVQLLERLLVVIEDLQVVDGGRSLGLMAGGERRYDHDAAPADDERERQGPDHGGTEVAAGVEAHPGDEALKPAHTRGVLLLADEDGELLVEVGR